jgi:hypothetical protein
MSYPIIIFFNLLPYYLESLLSDSRVSIPLPSFHPSPYSSLHVVTYIDTSVGNGDWHCKEAKQIRMGSNDRML